MEDEKILIEVLHAEQNFREEQDRVYMGNRQSARNLSTIEACDGTTFENCRRTLAGLRSVRLAGWNPTS